MPLVKCFSGSLPFNILDLHIMAANFSLFWLALTFLTIVV